jgi:hypothetical protein
MTTDAVKEVRSIGSGCGSPAAVSDGGNSNAGPSPLALLVPLVKHTTARGVRTILRRPQWPFQVGRVLVLSLMSGLAWMMRRLAEGAPVSPRRVGNRRPGHA